jgi:hypothetical protein
MNETEVKLAWETDMRELCARPIDSTEAGSGSSNPTMWRRGWQASVLVCFLLLTLATPGSAGEIEPTLIVGGSKVGAHQTDAGGYHGMLLASLPAFRVTDSLTLAGLGLAVRGGEGGFNGLDEWALGVPLVTYRRGSTPHGRRGLVAQAGVGLQGTKKYFFFVGLGVSVRLRGAKAAAVAPVAP